METREQYKREKKMFANIEEISLTKSKIDNIYCLFIGFDTRCFGIEQSNITPEEEGTVLELWLSSCETDDIFQEVRMVIPAVVTDSFQFMDMDISKSKEEVYIYFYEFPYEEDEIEEIDCDIKYESRRMGDGSAQEEEEKDE